MKLIDLRLLKRIRLETLHYKQHVETASLNTALWPSYGMTDDSYVTMYCRHLQAENLLDQLTKLHDMAKEFAEGNTEPEYRKWVEFYGEDGEPFEPFHTLEYCFVDETVYQLPEHIAEYAELVHYVKHFTTYVRAKENVFNQLFGELEKFHSVIDDEGNQEFIPESELGPELQEEVRLGGIVKEMQDVDVEYSLATYDDFYAACKLLFHTYRPDGDYQSCAAAIVALFA